MKGLFIISGLGILAMMAEIFKFKRLLYPIVLIGILAAYVANFMEFNNNMSIDVFNNMIRFDHVFSGLRFFAFWYCFDLRGDRHFRYNGNACENYRGKSTDVLLCRCYNDDGCHVL